MVGDPFVASLAEGQQVLVGNRGQDAVSADIAGLAVAAVVDLQARRLGVTVAATATVAVAAADGGGPSAPALARIIRTSSARRGARTVSGGRRRTVMPAIAAGGPDEPFRFPADHQHADATAQSPSRNSGGTGQPAEQEHKRGGVEEGFGGGDGGLEVLGEAAVAADPGEEAFDHPSPGVDGEADLPLGLAHDLDADAGWPSPRARRRSRRRRRPARRRASGAAMRAAAGCAPSRSCTRGGMGVQHQPAAVGVDHGVALAALDLLARVVAARPAGLAGLDALAVDHARPRGWPRRPARSRSSMTRWWFNVSQHARVAEAGEPSIDGLPRREAVGQHPPGTAAAQHIEDGVEDLAHRPSRWAPDRRRRRKQRRQHRPFGIRQVAGEAQALALCCARVVGVHIMPGSGSPGLSPCKEAGRAASTPARRPGQFREGEGFLGLVLLPRAREQRGHGEVQSCIARVTGQGGPHVRHEGFARGVARLRHVSG